MNAAKSTPLYPSCPAPTVRHPRLDRGSPALCREGGGRRVPFRASRCTSSLPLSASSSSRTASQRAPPSNAAEGGHTPGHLLPSTFAYARCSYRHARLRPGISFQGVAQVHLKPSAHLEGLNWGVQVHWGASTHLEGLNWGVQVHWGAKTHLEAGFVPGRRWPKGSVPRFALHFIPPTVCLVLFENGQPAGPSL